MENYNFLKPRKGYLVIKDLKDEDKGKGPGLVVAGEKESRAYGRVVAINEESEFGIDDILVYNEYEGQELFKRGLVDEEDLIILHENNILLEIDEDV